jgi:S-DNA-T family DNA segregation ATPase FtsK/SpoIIIE
MTASEVIARREKLASALGRPLGSIWPETDSQASPARLVLWVGDQDMASIAQSPWPLANANSVDMFDPFAFGEDSRGRAVMLSLAETNMLIGSLPGAGKSTTVRHVLLASALDPRAEIWAWEFKGTGDLSVFSRIATRYGSGSSDQTLASAMEGLRALKKECERRAGVISQLHGEGKCPENKVTSELANTPGLHPLVVALDEVHILFGDDRYRSEAAKLAEHVIKLGRALGVILILATQRPDRESLPTGVSGNVGTRFCLRVMDQVANDMILGTSSYQRGIRATLFTKRDRGMGYLLGEEDEAQIVRVYNVPREDAERVIDRALELRGGEVHQTVESDPEPPHSGPELLVDIASVCEPGERLWYAQILERLAQVSDHYTEWSGEYLGEQLRAAGIQTRQIGKRDGTKTINNKGIRVDDVANLLKGEK